MDRPESKLVIKVVLMCLHYRFLQLIYIFTTQDDLLFTSINAAAVTFSVEPDTKKLGTFRYVCGHLRYSNE